MASRPAGGLRDASAPAGYGAAPRSKKYVSKWTHGFFITINSMILYFKHIIRIDDFPLNGHPPSVQTIMSSPLCKKVVADILVKIRLLQFLDTM